MKQLSQLPIIKEISASKPFGAIINETDTIDGTPVVREIYNDPLINIYKLLQLTGITPDGTEDGETNGVGGIPKYQIIEALKRLANVLNDIEQVLTLSGGVWSVPFDLSILPNKYVFVAKATDNYTPGTFKGVNASPTYSFTSVGFNANDEVIVVIDQTGVKAYPLSNVFGNVSTDIFTAMGIPVNYGDVDTLYYQEEGNLITDTPSVDYIQETIRADVSDNTVLITDMFVMKGYILCVVYFPTEITYKFYQLSLGDLSTSEEVAQGNFNVPVGSDNVPYFYADDEALYITNSCGETATNNEISNCVYVPGSAILNKQADIIIDASFVKTTNAAAKAKKLYTMIDGNLCLFDLVSGIKTDLGNYNGIVGQLFNYKNNVYFTSGEVGKKWF